MRRDLILRALLPLGAAVALTLGAPPAVTGSLALAGLVLVGDALTRRRGTGAADRALVGVGGLLVVLVLTGMLLGSTPIGLSPTSWTVSLLVLSLAGLVVAALLPARPDAYPASVDGTVDSDGTGGVAAGPAARLLPWLAVAAVVVVLLVRTSAASLSAADEPPLQMSFGDVSGTDVQVVVTSGDSVGPLEVRTSSAGSDGTDVSYPLFDVADGGTVTTDLALPTSGRYLITLNRPDQTTALRTLVLDR